MRSPSTQAQNQGATTATDIKHALLDRKMTVTALAKKLRKPRPTVSAAIHQKNKFPRVRVLIEEALGV